jgi:hypothetical protein
VSFKPEVECLGDGDAWSTPASLPTSLDACSSGPAKRSSCATLVLLLLDTTPSIPSSFRLCSLLELPFALALDVSLPLATDDLGLAFDFPFNWGADTAMKGGDCRWAADIAGLASKSSFSFIARLSSASAKDIGSGMVSRIIC